MRPVEVPPVAGVDRVAALFAHEGAGRSIVTAAKYRPARPGRRWLADRLVAMVAVDRRPEVVTWVPASRDRRRRVGADPGARLAAAVAARLGVPSAALLRRGDDRAQTGRSRIDRLAGPMLSATTPMGGAAVLVIDDVITTGSSLRVAAAVLASAGARRVDAVAVAHRPAAHPTDGR